MRAVQSLAVVAFVFVAVSCGGRTVRTTASDPSAVDVSALWVEPTDLESRDLFTGPSSDVPPPAAGATFTFVKADASGYSPGYDVKDGNGVEWSVKLGPEAQTEVVSSRLLWSIGYHQVPTYYVASWAMTGGPGGTPGPARFRPERPGHTVVGEWSWYENEFVDTQAFRGLVVANVLLNNWDWKTSNNKIYETPAGRRYIVRDLGASFGKTDYPRALSWLPMRGLGQGSRNDLEDFEEQGFIRGVENGRVVFDYRGIHKSLVATLTPRDVAWTCALLARLSDAQLHDAFRAGGYAPDQSARFVAKIKAKIAEGLAVGSQVGAT